MTIIFIILDSILVFSGVLLFIIYHRDLARPDALLTITESWVATCHYHHPAKHTFTATACLSTQLIVRGPGGPCTVESDKTVDGEQKKLGNFSARRCPNSGQRWLESHSSKRSSTGQHECRRNAVLRDISWLFQCG